MAASDKTLKDLHAAVATALIEAIKPKEGETGEAIGASAAHLSVAIAFLKNNNITADPSTNAELDELKKQLQARRKKSPSPVELMHASDALHGQLGLGVDGMLQ